jgi:hypothetical protein
MEFPPVVEPDVIVVPPTVMLLTEVALFPPLTVIVKVPFAVVELTVMVARPVAVVAQVHDEVSDQPDQEPPPSPETAI